MHQVHEPSDDVRSCIIITHVLWSVWFCSDSKLPPNVFDAQEVIANRAWGWGCFMPQAPCKHRILSNHNQHFAIQLHAIPLKTGFSRLSEGSEDIMDCWCWAFRWRPFHAHVWYFHLLPVDLLTWGAFQSGVFEDPTIFLHLISCCLCPDWFEVCYWHKIQDSLKIKTLKKVRFGN